MERKSKKRKATDDLDGPRLVEMESDDEMSQFRRIRLRSRKMRIYMVRCHGLFRQQSPKLLAEKVNNNSPMWVRQATYPGACLFEVEINGVAVMRRRSGSWLNATQILKMTKVAGVDKGTVISFDWIGSGSDPRSNPAKANSIGAPGYLIPIRVHISNPNNYLQWHCSGHTASHTA
jgi:hypothetical protein